MKSDETLYRAAYDLILEKMPDPPLFDQIRTQTVELDHSRLHPSSVFVGPRRLSFCCLAACLFYFLAGKLPPDRS